MSQGKVYFNLAEKEIIEALCTTFEITELEAKEQVINQKRELAFYHRRSGNVELAKQLISEIGETWVD